MAEKWIQKAIKHPGAMRALAKKEGALNPDGTIKRSWLLEKAKSKNPTTRRRALLALTLRKLNK